MENKNCNKNYLRIVYTLSYFNNYNSILHAISTKFLSKSYIKFKKFYLFNHLSVEEVEYLAKRINRKNCATQLIGM